jgi:hypothetical protein
MRMARGALLFRERELTRAIRAMAKAGQSVARVEIGRDGKMIFIVGKPGAETTAEAGDLDNWLATHARAP